MITQKSPRTVPTLFALRAARVVLLPCFCLWLGSFAVKAPMGDAQEVKPPVNAVRELELQQKQLAQRFSKLEELFLRMSELEAVANPTRAGLLMQAAQMSKQLATLQRLNGAGDLLSQGQFTRAIQEQEAGRENLKKLLELLQSENRSSRLKDERKRIEDIQKEIQRLEQIQRGQTARTESGQDFQQSATDQKDIKEQLEKVESDLKAAKEADDKSKLDKQDKADKPTGEQSQGDKPKDEKDSDSPKDDKPKEANDDKGNEPPKEGDSRNGADPKPQEDTPKAEKSDKPNESKEGESPKEDKPNKEGQPTPDPLKTDPPKTEPPKTDLPMDPKETPGPKESKPSDSQNESTENSESSPSQEPSKPETREEKAKKRVEAAKKRMEKAQKKLEEKDREEAVREQREAERELREAIEELEKILRQLREEEIERSLVDVETRLRKMLDLERAVREQTETLGNLTGDAKERTLEIQANKLSIEQTKVVMEGQKALLLLQDEGSSTAFPEALQQINIDAQAVSKRLTEANVSASTRLIEDEIIGALEEMLDSLKQVQKKRDEKKRKPNPQQQQQSDDGDQPLVDGISELKLLKTLQLRVNRRTQLLAKQTDNQEDVIGQVADPDLKAEINDLAARQDKIHEVARDILLKATKARE